MTFAEPPGTGYDLRFRLVGVPVRVHPLFWLVAVVLGWSPELIEVGIWIAVLFVSILAHEMGHALVLRAQGHRPQVQLHAMGGLTSWIPGAGMSPAGRIAVSLAGPGAGFLVAGLVVAGLHLAGARIAFFTIPLGSGPPPSPLVQLLVLDLLLVNVFWGLVNLAPVLPLDGGQVAQTLLGTRGARALSVAAGAAIAVLGYLYLGSIFMAILFGYLAFANYQALRPPRAGNPPW